MPTLGYIWSGVRSRLTDPNAAQPAVISLEANAALDELRGRIRQSREDWLDITETTDILSGKDIYDYPARVDTLKMVERIDQGATHGIYPSIMVGYHERYLRNSVGATRLIIADTVTLMPERRLQISPAPTVDFKDGLRWTYLPRPIMMASPSDEAGIPEQFGEWLIVATLDRVRQFRGVELADPGAFEQFRKEQSFRLERELRPKELMTPNHIIDEDEFYSFR